MTRTTRKTKPRGREAARWTLFAALALALVLTVPLVADEESREKPYVCPPCGADCHKASYDEGGDCPVCRMELVKRDTVIDVAILLFDGVQIIDYTGPYEVFGQARFNVFTVSHNGETISTAMDMSVNPSYSFANSPKPDIILVPGGGIQSAMDNPKVKEWLLGRAPEADYVMSICNGAFILAQSGLLDGLSATTFYGLITELKAAAPNVNVVRDRRFVDNGKIITSAGLSSGIDASLHLVSKIKGRGAAQRLALHLEYQWDPDSEFARAALADRQLPEVDPPDAAEIELADTRGDRDHWRTRWLVRTELSLTQLATHFNDQLERLNGWDTTAATVADGQARAQWTFADDDGNAWQAQTQIERAAIQNGYTMTMTLDRATVAQVAAGSAD